MKNLIGKVFSKQDTTLVVVDFKNDQAILINTESLAKVHVSPVMIPRLYAETCIVYNDSELEDLLNKHSDKMTQDGIEAEKKSNEFAKKVDDIRNSSEYSHLDVNGKVGANIKKHLKKLFPEIKFSVKSNHYSVNIHWTDNVPCGTIYKAVEMFKAGNFDSMQDMYEYNRDNAFTKVFNTTDYIFCNRELSDKYLNNVFVLIKNKFNIDITVEEYKRNGFLYKPEIVRSFFFKYINEN